MRLGFVLLFLAACGSTGDPKVTREQCRQVADHIAAIMVDHCLAHADECWDLEVAPVRDAGVPEAVTKATFKSFLDTTEGKTWLMQRQGQWRSLNEAAVDPCVKSATPKLVSCLLAAKSHDDVTACDAKK